MSLSLFRHTPVSAFLVISGRHTLRISDHWHHSRSRCRPAYDQRRIERIKWYNASKRLLLPTDYYEHVTTSRWPISNCGGERPVRVRHDLRPRSAGSADHVICRHAGTTTWRRQRVGRRPIRARDLPRSNLSWILLLFFPPIYDSRTSRSELTRCFMFPTETLPIALSDYAWFEPCIRVRLAALLVIF